MSLLYSKQTISKTDLIDSLTLLFKPKSQQDFDLACQYFGSLMKIHTKEVFNILRQKHYLKFVEPKTQNLLNILFVIHSNIEEESIANQLREPAIYWLQKLMVENKESFKSMLNEIRTNQSYITIQQNIEKQQQFDIYNQVIKLEQYQIKPKIFCIIYYSYLQKLSINLFVYKSIKNLQYSFDEFDDMKGKLLWIYKIQNMMLMGLKLLEYPNQKFKLYQDFIYQNMIQFLIFIRQEIEQLIDQYAIISNLDCLSLYEIYIEYLRTQKIVEKYCSDIDLKIRLNIIQIEEFLNFQVRIKIVNQYTFKKSLKVPSRHQPNIQISDMEGKINRQQHQKAQSYLIHQLSDETQIKEERQENKQYMEVNSNRQTHIKGLSTFQQN